MLSNKMAEFIWVNGTFIPWEEAKVHVLTHSLHYAGSVYEGIRSYKGNIFKLEEHIIRLLKSAESMHLKVDYSLQEICLKVQELLQKNGLKNAYIRPLIWRGAESLGVYNANLSTNIMLMAVPSNPSFQNGLTINLSPWRKMPAESLPPQSKSSAHYAMATVTLDIAKTSGYDDSLFLDTYGNIAECTVTNIFFGRGRELITPIADRFLNGITRQEVIKLARTIGFKVTEARLTLDEAEKYDSCFLAGTSAEIKGVSSIDIEKRKLIFSNEKIVKELQQEFAHLVGKEL